MFVIGIDPHKASHTGAVLDEQEAVVDRLRLAAGKAQAEQLMAFASAYAPRVWAVEGASGVGSLVARQLAAAGETVLDVPPALSARVRLLGTSGDKSDAHDARSVAVVALRHQDLRQVTAEDHTTVLRLLAKRHHSLTAARTRAVCQLHAMLCQLTPGGLPRGLTAPRAEAELRGLDPADVVDSERCCIAWELLAELRRIESDLKGLKARIAAAVTTAGTTVTDICGVGPIVAAILIGYTGDITRFPTAGHYARYNGTAPIEASSGPKTRHRLNMRGNRQLNHALYVAAVTQTRNATPGRVYYLRKQAEGKTRKEAMRALKRRISDTIYRQLLADTKR